MANSITFTPIATTSAPSPSSVTITPTTAYEFLVQEGVHSRQIEQVKIDRTEYGYTRDRGRLAKPVTVIGTDTFANLANAKTQLAKMEQLPGASCTIVSDVWGTVTNAKCININEPRVDRNAVGYHINYRFDFVVDPS